MMSTTVAVRRSKIGSASRMSLRTTNTDCARATSCGRASRIRRFSSSSSSAITRRWYVPLDWPTAYLRRHRGHYPLNRARADARRFYGLQDTRATSQQHTDLRFLRASDRRAATVLPVGPRTINAGPHAFLDHAPLDLSEHAHHAEHSVAVQIGSVQPLLMQVQPAAARFQLHQEADKALQGSAEPIHRPRCDHVDVALGARLQHRSERRPLAPLIPAFSKT